MLIDKTHLGWGSASAVVLAACTAGYIASTSGGREAAGGSAAGLAFGTLALATMIFAGLLAVRKKFPGLRLGSAQFWLRGHIWLGLLSVPLVFFHSGFRFGGTLERALMYVFLIVIASGVYGLALQQVLPRVLKVRVPLETFPQQIPMLCKSFQEDATKLVDSLKKAAARRAGPVSGIRAASVVAAAPAAKAGAAPAKSVDKEALAAKLAMMKAGAAKPASGDSAAEKSPTMKGVAAKSVDKGASVAEKIAAMKAAAAGKVSAPSSGGEPSPATPPTATPPDAETDSTAATPAKGALDKAAFMAQLAAKKAAAKAKSDSASVPTPAAAASDANAPSEPPPSAAEKPAIGDKAAFMAALAAKKAAAGAAKRKDSPVGVVAAAGAQPNKPAAAPMSTMTRVAETGMPRLSLLLRFYDDEVRPFFDPDERTASRQRVASENYARMAFANLAAELPSQALETIEKLEDMVTERRQFLVQARIQRWLRNWLLIHVPLSAALFVLAALHLVVALRVVPWN